MLITSISARLARISPRHLMLSLCTALLLGCSVGCGGYQSIDYRDWEVYRVPRGSLAAERAKLAKVVREVLLHRHYYTEPGSVSNLETPGREGSLETHWNDEDARQQQGSMLGHRYKVGVRIREGLSHIPARKGNDPIEERYLNLATQTDPDIVYLTMSIGCIAEVNKRMNISPGDYDQAEWHGAGQANDVSNRLRSEIRKRFAQIAERSQNDGREGSDRTAKIMERGSDTQQNPDANDHTGTTWGPGSGGQGDQTPLDFGTGVGRN
ncbi:MAG: hypothetical protein AB7K09_15840 [Planctomycetota bacterium]